MKAIFSAIIFVLLAGLSTAQVSYPSLNMNLLSHLDPETNVGSDGRKYSGCWGWYQASKNKEYAIVGTSHKTYFIDVTNPSSPQIRDSVMARLSGCTWRELKTYQHYCYVASDDGAPAGSYNSFQIIDMQYLPDSVHLVYDDTTYFERAHTLWVDGDKLYAGGPTNHGAGLYKNMKVFSLANPQVPVYLRTLADDYPSVPYVHDMYARHDTVYASVGWTSTLQIFKYNAVANNFTQLGSISGYPEPGYNHSSSLTADGKTLVFCDETPNTSFKVADVTNFGNITISALARPNTNTDFVAHNPYVVGNKWAFVSCYQDGLTLYDISNPSSPVLKGFFDTYPQGGANAGNNYGGTSYRGNWGAYPFFPSGLILACDMQNGIFLLEANSLMGTFADVKENAGKSAEASVYPNPAKGRVNVTFANNNAPSHRISIINAMGQTVYSEESRNDCNFPITFKTIDVSALAAGTYVLSLVNGEATYQQKIIISD